MRSVDLGPWKGPSIQPCAAVFSPAESLSSAHSSVEASVPVLRAQGSESKEASYPRAGQQTETPFTPQRSSLSPLAQALLAGR